MKFKLAMYKFKLSHNINWNILLNLVFVKSIHLITFNNNPSVLRSLTNLRKYLHQFELSYQDKSDLSLQKAQIKIKNL